jgi:hypothetical protein
MDVEKLQNSHRPTAWKIELQKILAKIYSILAKIARIIAKILRDKGLMAMRAQSQGNRKAW